MIPHFGITKILPYLAYFGSIVLYLISLKRPIIGYYTIILLLPFEIIKERLPQYIQANNIFDYYFLAVIFGILIKNCKSSGKNRLINSYFDKIPIYIIIYTFFTVIYGTLHFGLGNPFSFDNNIFLDWKNYILMPILYIITRSLIKNESQAKITTYIIIFSLAAASWYYFINYHDKNLSKFSWHLKDDGIIFPTLGGNEFAAFCVHFIFLPLVLLFFENDIKLKFFYVIVVVVTMYPVLFLFSRGAYIAIFVSFVYLSFRLKKTFMILFVILLFLLWNLVLPTSVINRIEMTKQENGMLDDSAESRIVMWEKCFKMFLKSPLFGAGYDTFRFFGGRNDPHNYYVEILATQGIIGIAFIFYLLLHNFKNGQVLLGKKLSQYTTGLGISIQCITLSIAITNLFGDRWSYFHLGGYYWVLMAIAESAKSFKSKKIIVLENRIVAINV